MYILETKKEKKKIVKTLKHKSYPYPKKDEYVENIVCISVTEKDVSTPIDNFYLDSV